MQVRKAVIPAAGKGTRFLPLTKTIPKELLPVLDRPMIHYVLEEALDAGITEFIIVSNSSKIALIEYLQSGINESQKSHPEVGRDRSVRRILNEGSYTFVNQEMPLGLADAINTAREAIQDEPFAVLLPDDIIYSSEPAISKVMAIAEEFNASTLAVEHVSMENVSNYGIIEPEWLENQKYKLITVEEKPDPQYAKSNLGIIGRYIFTPSIFDALSQVTPGKNGELQLTDGIALLLHNEDMFACHTPGTRFDVGNPIGLLKASVAFGLSRETENHNLRQWLITELSDSNPRL